MRLKAIETSYRGIKFRSRLEARWAIFFDTLKVPFQYEYEGFELPSGRYLPDFDIGPGKYFFEVKGQKITNQELMLACELADMKGTTVLIAHSGFTWSESLGKYNPEVTWCNGMHGGANDLEYWGNIDWGDVPVLEGPSFQHGMTMHLCFECRTLYAAVRSCGLSCRMKPDPTCTGKHAMLEDDYLQNAYRAAVGARFEFNERK